MLQNVLIATENKRSWCWWVECIYLLGPILLWFCSHPLFCHQYSVWCWFTVNSGILRSAYNYYKVVDFWQFLFQYLRALMFSDTYLWLLYLLDKFTVLSFKYCPFSLLSHFWGFGDNLVCYQYSHLCSDFSYPFL